MHPLFPDCSSRYMTSAKICFWCTHQMYNFCVLHGLQEVWGYMWTAWYQLEWWQLWAWSTDLDLLSCLHTTMVVENFWQQFEHFYLQYCARPWIDLAIWIINTEVVPEQKFKIDHLDPAYHPRCSCPKTPFQRAFSWRQLCDRPIGDWEYKTDVIWWICDCGSQSVWAQHLCKHLVQAVGKEIPVTFFNEIHHRHSTPLYHHPALGNAEHCDPVPQKQLVVDPLHGDTFKRVHLLFL